MEMPPDFDQEDTRTDFEFALFEAITQRNLYKAVIELQETQQYNLDGLRFLHDKTFQIEEDCPLSAQQEILNYQGERPPRDDWFKVRDLGKFFPPHTAYYSGLEDHELEAAQKAIEQTLPHVMHGLSLDEKIVRLANLYAELDYLHLFNDGNSRVNRMFVWSIAQSNGINIHFNLLDHQEMYAARDKAVAQINLQRRAEHLTNLECLYYSNAKEGVEDSIELLEKSFPDKSLNNLFLKATGNRKEENFIKISSIKRKKKIKI